MYAKAKRRQSRKAEKFYYRNKGGFSQRWKVRRSNRHRRGKRNTSEVLPASPLPPRLTKRKRASNMGNFANYENRPPSNRPCQRRRTCRVVRHLRDREHSRSQRRRGVRAYAMRRGKGLADNPCSPGRVRVRERRRLDLPPELSGGHYGTAPRPELAVFRAYLYATACEESPKP